MKRLVFLTMALLFAGCSTPTAPPASTLPATMTSAPTFEVKGALTLNANIPVKPGASCAGAGGYSDIVGGAQVKITDSAGKILALGKLDDGVAWNDIVSAAVSTSCTFNFSVPKVPTSGTVYGIEVSNRGIANFKQAEAFALDLTLGVKPTPAASETPTAPVLSRLCEALRAEHPAGRDAAFYILEAEPLSTLEDVAGCPEYADTMRLAMRGFDDGSYQIGPRDLSVVPAGTYVTQPGTRDCYWERSTASGKIIANDMVTFASGGVTVTIKSSDGGFTSRGCSAWLPKA